jgi:hypothetical protein
MPERHLHTEIHTSTEFCTQHKSDVYYNALAQTKWNLKQLGLREL